MRMGYVVAPGRGDTDLLLAGVAERLLAEGAQLCGTVQFNTACEGEGPCDMDVRVLPGGPVIRISQSLGPGARGCRLDPGALETAIAACEQVLDMSDALIVNKFGKQEALGRGFRGLIGEAMGRGMPVLVGVNALNRAAVEEFTGGAAEAVAPDPDGVVAWLKGALAEARDAESWGSDDLIVRLWRTSVIGFWGRCPRSLCDPPGIFAPERKPGSAGRSDLCADP